MKAVVKKIKNLFFDTIQYCCDMVPTKKHSIVGNSMFPWKQLLLPIKHCSIKDMFKNVYEYSFCVLSILKVDL